MKTPLRSLVVPPYPHSILASPAEPPAYTTPGTPLCEELLALWAPTQIFDEPIPPHWTSNFLYSDYDDDEPIQWWRYLPTMDGGSIAWEMEHTAHYHGTLSLLLYCERDRVAVFRKGGLLFLCIQDTDQVFLARAGVKATELARVERESVAGSCAEGDWGRARACRGGVRVLNVG